MHRIGVIGASGYTGAELLRLLVQHPETELVCVTSRQYAGQPVAEIFPSLQGLLDLTFEDVEDPAQRRDEQHEPAVGARAVRRPERHEVHRDDARDDAAVQRQIASRILEKLGYVVATASSGEAAVAYVKENAVDLLAGQFLQDPGDPVALLVITGAAIGQRQFQAGVAAEDLGIRVNLDGEFAGRCQHQGARLRGLAPVAGRLVQQVIIDGDQEGRGLAGTGLRLPGNIPAGQRHWQRFRLNRGAF